MNTNNEAYLIPSDSVREWSIVDATVCNREFAIHCALALIDTDSMITAQADNKKTAAGSLSAYLFNRVVRADFPVSALSEFRAVVLESAKSNGMLVRYKQDKKGRDTKELADPEALKSLFSMCRSITASPYRSEALKETGLRKAYDACRNLEQAAKFREASERAQKEQMEVAKRQQELADEQAQQAETAKADAILSGDYAKTLAQRVTEARKAYESQVQAIREEAYCLDILDALDAELGETREDPELLAQREIDAMAAAAGARTPVVPPRRKTARKIAA